MEHLCLFSRHPVLDSQNSCRPREEEDGRGRVDFDLFNTE